MTLWGSGRSVLVHPVFFKPTTPPDPFVSCWPSKILQLPRPTFPQCHCCTGWIFMSLTRGHSADHSHSQTAAVCCNSCLSLFSMKSRIKKKKKKNPRTPEHTPPLLAPPTHSHPSPPSSAHPLPPLPSRQSSLAIATRLPLLHSHHPSQPPEGSAAGPTDVSEPNALSLCSVILSLSPRWNPTLLSPKQNRFSISTP